MFILGGFYNTIKSLCAQVIIEFNTNPRAMSLLGQCKCYEGPWMSYVLSNQIMFFKINNILKYLHYTFLNYFKLFITDGDFSRIKTVV